MSDLGPLIGTPSRFTIFDDMGHMIVKEGEIITQGVIQAAAAAGRLDALRMSLAMECPCEGIVEAPEYIEIGEEEPTGVHPE